MTVLRRLFGTMAILGAAMLAACGGGEAPTRVVEVEHAAASFPDGASHVSYQVLSDAGEWIPLGPEFGLDGRHLVEVPKDTSVLLVRAHSGEHEVLAEDLYLVPQAEDVVLGAEPSPPEAYSRWMTTDEQIQASALNQITIPGAHDAGMGTVNSCSNYANADTTQTQDSSIKEMLQNGIRYFDMRPMYSRDGAQMRLGHYGWVDLAFEIDYLYGFSIKNYEGCTGYTVVQALEHVREFMAGSGNREVVILKMSHFMNLNTHPGKGSYFDPADFDWLEMIVKEKLGPYLLIGNRDFRSTPISQLTETGPKVIVTFDAKERAYDGSNGLYAEDDLALYDKYSDTSALGDMKPDQLDKMAFYGSRTLQGWIEWYFCDRYYGNTQCYKRAKASHLDHSPYFVLSWTLTQNDHQIAACTVGEPLRTAMSVAGYKCKTLMELGTEANAALPAVLAKAKATLRYPNVLYVDRAGKKTTDTAIAINRLQ